MAIQKTIIINVDTSKATKNTEELQKSIQDLAKEQDKKNKLQEKQAVDQEKQLSEQKKQTEELTKANTNLVRGLKTVANGFKGVGLAVKAMGVGLIIQAFEIVKELFTNNQIIADKLGIAMKGLQVVFNDLFSFILKNGDGIIKTFQKIFDNPVESLKSFGQAIKDNIIERFNSAIEVIGFLSDAVQKFFSGDYKGAIESVKEAGKEMVDVYTGIDGSVEIIGKAVEKTKEYASIVLKSAEALQKQEEQSRLAVVQQSRLIEQYDRQAEKQRQLRDNDSLTIQERIEANNKLGEILDEQEKQMIKQANLQIQAAQNQLSLNDTIDNRIALEEALANKEGVLAQIEGFRSEQIVNRVGLEKELNDLNQAAIDGVNERAIIEKKYAIDRAKSDEDKLTLTQELLDLENQIIEADIERKRELYKEGTQARIDAENEYLAKKTEIDLQARDLAVEIAKKENELEESKIQKKLDYLSKIQEIANAETTIGKAALIIKQGLALKELVMEAKKTIAFSKAAFAKSTLAVAEGTAQTAKVGFPQNIPLLVGYAAQSVGIISAVKQAVSSAGQVTGNVAPPTTSAPPQAPSFNLIQGTGSNQIAETLAKDKNPIKAYVVSSEVTTSQALDRRIQDTASI